VLNGGLGSTSYYVSFVIDASVFQELCSISSMNATGGSESLAVLQSPSSCSVFECDDCGRSFDSYQALKQHLNSPAHDRVYECDECDQSFGSQQAPDQQLNSPYHIPWCLQAMAMGLDLVNSIFIESIHGKLILP
jgi:hypothetical protein